MYDRAVAHSQVSHPAAEAMGIDVMDPANADKIND